MAPPLHNPYKKKVDMVWIGVLFGLCYWIYQTLRDTYILNQGEFIDNLLSPDLISFGMRLLVVCIIILFTLHTKYLEDKKQQSQENIFKSSTLVAFLLAGIAFVILFWILESFQDIIIQEKGALAERLLAPDTSQALTKFLTVFVLIALILFIIYLIYARNKANKAIQEAHDKLQRTKDNLQKIVTSDADGKIVLDPNGIVQFINPAAEKILEKKSEEFIGKELDHKIHTEEMTELEIKNSLNEMIYAEARTVDIEWEHEEAVLASLRDITEKKQIEQMRSNLLSLISVKLKSPVAGIMGAIENMLEGFTGELSKKQVEYLELMYENITTKYDLIEEMLMVLNIVSGNSKAKIAPTDIKPLLETLQEKFTPQMKAKKIDLNLDMSSAEIKVSADKEKLTVVLNHVLQNAIKFTSKGSVSIQAKQQDNSAIIEIIDTGAGMDEKTLKSIFLKERMIDKTPDPAMGLGFGLYIAKKYMALMQGDIQAESVPGKGSTFILTIPLD